MFTKLSASVDQYEGEKKAYLTELNNIVEEIQVVESNLEETKPSLARYDDCSGLLFFVLCFRMSLQFDPSFVAEQVVILEAGLQEMGEKFIATSQKIGILNTALADKNAHLRSTFSPNKDLKKNN